MPGTFLDGVVEKVTDGDTVRVIAQDTLFKTRVQCLDTEESQKNDKPMTPWGIKAKEFATALLPPGARVRLEFAGTGDPLVNGEINHDYLDNFGRPLAFLHLLDRDHGGMTDLTEIMIREGFSPYFVKYGRALYPDHDARYRDAEREAQRRDIGVWNQLAANGVTSPDQAPRDYALLSVWWEVRAAIIDAYRQERDRRPEGTLTNSRRDFSRLTAMAQAGETATVFMELAYGEPLGAHYVARTNSRSQDFQVFLRDADRPEMAEVIALLTNRYFPDGPSSPRRNYAYVSGRLRLFAGRPQIEVEGAAQITDAPPA